jgi:hypothetical protein
MRTQMTQNLGITLFALLAISSAHARKSGGAWDFEGKQLEAYNLIFEAAQVNPCNNSQLLAQTIQQISKENEIKVLPLLARAREELTAPQSDCLEQVLKQAIKAE